MDPLPCLKGVTKVQGSNRGHVPGGWHHYCMLCCGQMLRACGFLVSPAVTSCAAAGPAAIAKVLHSRQSALEQFITSSVSTMTVAAAEAACTAGSTAAAADGEVQQSTGPFSSPEALDAHVERAWAHFRSLGSPQWHVAPMVDQVGCCSRRCQTTNPTCILLAACYLHADAAMMWFWNSSHLLQLLLIRKMTSTHIQPTDG